MALVIANNVCGTPSAATQVAGGTEGLTIAINGAAAQPILRVEGLTFRQGGVLLILRRPNGGGPVTELRYDTGTARSILARS
ncbi:MAG TPA: hypothetical protein VHG08_21995 [Longimicrobium sp.]|nr:hypothetical protein [Longimicrobium sp.]